MPYVGSETPAVGDYVKNEWEQPALLPEFTNQKEQHERINVMWDDGWAELVFALAQEFTLLSRKPTWHLSQTGHSRESLSALKLDPSRCESSTAPAQAVTNQPRKSRVRTPIARHQFMLLRSSRSSGEKWLYRPVSISLSRANGGISRKARIAICTSWRTGGFCRVVECATW
jgi:hypothetical protein